MGPTYPNSFNPPKLKFKSNCCKFYILSDEYILGYVSYTAYDNAPYLDSFYILFDGNQFPLQFVIVATAI